MHCPAVALPQRRLHITPSHARAATPRIVRAAAPSTSTPLGSLIPDTLEEMEGDTELQAHLARLGKQGQAELTRAERITRQRALDKLDLPAFGVTCKTQGVSPLVRAPATTLQLNIGLYCNQACSHCHVESSPKRTEMMDRATADRCIALMRSSPDVTTVDITGGAPELNDQFRHIVREARALGLAVLDRCNLTVLMEPGQEDLGQFLADNQVQVVASLPCYSASNTDKQRGAGVFERSIAALKQLNDLGYGKPGSGLDLDLVYNPGGDSLAPEQAKLESAYKSELFDCYGIVFSRLFCLNNMPIKRFADFLSTRGKMESYMSLLAGAFNPAAAEGVMCRGTVSVGWDGRLYDCDFNQQLEMAMGLSGLGAPGAGADAGADATASSSSSSSSGSSAPSSEEGPRKGGGLTVFDLADLSQLTGRPIRVDNHCYGCTAGAGSSCTGATV
ncbi:hypothetical protein FOA52_007076 [Chlamydomonas sp. UWO 241]|nr:hypothetical protein FOA52_007076 [Chlamydomonas sp. UWO 241]